MKLIIREYLSTLKEAGELDVVVPDLLTSMGIVPLSKPQRGRQFGVDILAVGEDPNDGKKKVFLITAKAGDVDRTNWDTGNKNDVRPELVEIVEVYIPRRLDSDLKNYPIKVVLCCNGDLSQNARENWNGFKDFYSGKGGIEFAFWGADELSILIEENILDEFLFPESAQKQLRKTLSLLDDNDYSFIDYYNFLESVFKDDKVSSKKNTKGDKSRHRAISLVNLSLNIVYKWAEDNNNIMPAYKCSERAILVVFEWLRKNDLLGREEVIEEYASLLQTFNKVSNQLLLKVKKHTRIRDGLFQSGQQNLEYSITSFELLGILATVGLFQLNISTYNKDLAFRGNAIEIALDLMNLLENNPGAKRPVFDEHGIDICLGAILLHQLGFDNFLDKWLNDQLNRVIFAYRTGNNYPVSTDSFDDLLERDFNNDIGKEKLFNLSTLLPTLIQWVKILDNKENYEMYAEAVENFMSDVNFQLWTATQNTERFYYTEKITNQTGSTFASIEFEKTYKEGVDQLARLKENCVDPQSFKSISCGFPFILFVASRHHRNPIPPFTWLSLLDDNRTNECIAVTNSGNKCSRAATEGKYCWQHSN